MISISDANFIRAHFSIVSDTVIDLLLEAHQQHSSDFLLAISTHL